MAKILLLLFGIIVFQRCSKAAPSEPSEPTETTLPVITASVEGDVTLDSEPNSEKIATNEHDASQSQRQKRYYDFTGFDYSPIDFPPAFPYPNQPHYSKRDDSRNTAVYGEDSLSVIFRKLHEIVRDVRYQNTATTPRPVHTPIQAYIPFIYIPYDCGCPSNNQGPAPPINNPTPQPPLPPTSTEPANGIGTTPNTSVTLGNRGGFDDTKQNWGIVTNRPNLNDINNLGDGSRPINFDPIPPEDSIDMPPVPPVDHGTVQAGAAPPQNRFPINSTPKAQRIPVSNYLPEATLDLPSSNSKSFVPSLCDGAIISCCNRPQITDKCFEALGCEDPSIYGNPCDPKVQLMVINKFQYFQKRRSG